MINKFKDVQFKNLILSLLFSVSLTSWTMSTFFGITDILNIAAALVLHSILFLGLSFITRNRLPGIILFFAGSILYVVITACILMLTSRSIGMDYFIWIVVSQPDSDKFNFGFWIATLLIWGYGFSTTVFYFTMRRFRVFVLFLLGVVPLLLQTAKSDKEIILPSLIFLFLFFLMNIERARRKIGKESRIAFINDRWYAISMAFFAAITLVVCYIAPKPYSVPKIVYLDSIINRTIQPLGLAIQNAVQNQDTSLMAFDPGGYKSESRITSIIAPLGEKVLFEVRADEPLYLRIQTWDSYKKNRWVNGEESLNMVQPVESYAKRQMSLGVIVPLIESIKGNPDAPPETLKLLDTLKRTSFPAKKKTALISSKGFKMKSFMHPPGVVKIETQKKTQKIVMNEKLFCSALSESYSVEYISKNLIPASREFQVVKRLDRETADFLLNPDNYGEFVEKESPALNSSESRSVLEASKKEMEIAYKYFTKLPPDIPERVYKLAKEITSKRTSDYDKASAIEQFFHRENFKYSNQPARLPEGMDYNDFFLFENRKGVCLHFASAMVILARACGLPARYVEGYVADEKDPETGLYLVREKDGHAFPEVYIAGYGWMVFEPTISADESDNVLFEFMSGFGNNFTNFAASLSSFVNSLPMWLKMSFIPVLALIILLMIYYSIRIRERIWRKHLLKSGSDKSLEQIFKRITVLLKKINFDMKKYETPSVYSVRISEELGLELSGLSDVFNRSKYGRIGPSQEDVKNAVEAYDRTLALVRKRLGFLRSWMI